MSKPDSVFGLLKQKEILQILDGDTVLGTEGDTEISMPYLSGPDLVGICNRFGLPTTYGSLSRWVYLDDLMAHCIAQNTIGSLLAFLFSKPQFSEMLSGKGRDEIEASYQLVVTKAIERINGILYFSGKELIRTGDSFLMVDAGTDFVVSAPAIEAVDRGYVRRMSERAREEVLSGNYDSAITKARTLLEEVFCHVIELKGETLQAKATSEDCTNK